MTDVIVTSIRDVLIVAVGMGSITLMVCFGIFKTFEADKNKKHD